MSIPVILIFDVGKTNKKLFLFNEQYQIVYEQSVSPDEIVDEDGFNCEDVSALTTWIKISFKNLYCDTRFDIRAVNFSAYGASFVYVDENMNALLPLYNYLKPYPAYLQKQFYQTYGDENSIARQTASPALGSLNSGMQLYRLKYEKSNSFNKIQYALHLPQYLSAVISGNAASDITSIGCHTQLWDFQKNDYHKWVYAEGVQKKFAAINPVDETTIVYKNNKSIAVGIGLHDSSAALIPYLKLFAEPFILISTGTWCISFNPFNYSALTDHELHHDCLCYLTYKGKAIKAARLFAGCEHEEQVKRIAAHYKKNVTYYKSLKYNAALLHNHNITDNTNNTPGNTALVEQSVFGTRTLDNFKTYEEAYHQLIFDIMQQQVYSTGFVLSQTPVQKIFVDGGFGKNDVYMHLLASSFPNTKVYAADIAQASALGAALVLHDKFSKEEIAADIISLKYYPSQ